ncbi:hypothetical protein ND861_14055 [Leptospira sp. 2 VSF19]|uniref:Uncharacterized protein n=1 Tax=Leptospira soteropolitanensis TaxID=2950025 RepID=A0AAW5VFQ0_9LEPT|nr:hypothetical protein [Leptospira soteropolitanensis]MCW7493767.1 hypothetical protein [Leptospira soteropolitanensis]MCW7501365.1 hypothetical protein [Leptospira soteropolitanensis]MCW7523449.1 hypothetical protein [Leptospira soteropolitanensis]MCW7527479.1 hypothetical protein [Leptospira soteropolitanensis]MCW7531335.1 hypothetical protein [Leptospira soteropolitanensis]
MAMFRLSGVSRLDQLKIYSPIFIQNLEDSHKRELMITDQASKILSTLRKLCVPDLNQSYFAFQLNVDSIKENELKVYGKPMITLIQNLLDNHLAMPIFYLTRVEEVETANLGPYISSMIGPIQVELAIVSYSGDRFEEKYALAFNAIAARSFVNLQNFLVDNYKWEPFDFFQISEEFLNLKPYSIIRQLLEEFETPFAIDLEFKEELIDYLEQGFLDSEIYFFLPYVGWIYFDTTDPIQKESEYSPFFEKKIVPKLFELEPSLKESYELMKTKLSETKFDELRSKTYLPQIEFAETIESILFNESAPILEFVKIYHLLCLKAEKISEEKAEREAKQHFDILYTMMKMGDNFISRFLLIGQTLYSGRDRVIEALKSTDDVMHCEYYFNSTFYWVFLSKDIASAIIVLDKIIEQYYEGDHTLYIFELLMEKYPEVKKSFLTNQKFKTLYKAAKNKVYWKQVSLIQRLFRFFVGDVFPIEWEKNILSKIKYTQMKAKYLPRMNKTKPT